MKTASRWPGKKKSGVPGTVGSRSFQPLMAFLTTRPRKRLSVDAFEVAFIARMLSDRCLVVLNLNKFGLPDNRKVAQT
jgi:hypothetical protein